VVRQKKIPSPSSHKGDLADSGLCFRRSDACYYRSHRTHTVPFHLGEGRRRAETVLRSPPHLGQERTTAWLSLYCALGPLPVFLQILARKESRVRQVARLTRVDCVSGKERDRQVTKVTWRSRDCVSVAQMHAATALTALIPYHSISVRDVEERKPCCVRLHTSGKSGPPRGSRCTVLSDRFLTNSGKKRVPSPPSHKADSGGLCFWQRKRPSSHKGDLADSGLCFRRSDACCYRSHRTHTVPFHLGEGRRRAETVLRSPPHLWQERTTAWLSLYCALGPLPVFLQILAKKETVKSPKVTWRTRYCVSVAQMHAATALTALIPYHSISVRDVEERESGDRVVLMFVSTPRA
jgi:hypothetical protein